MATSNDDFVGELVENLHVLPDHALAKIITVFPADEKLLMRSNGAYMRDAVELSFSSSKTIVMYEGDELHKRDMFGRFFREPESDCEVIKKTTHPNSINRNHNESVDNDVLPFYTTVFRIFSTMETLIIDFKMDDSQALALAGRLHSMERLKTFGIFRGNQLTELSKRMLAVSVNHANIKNVGFYDLGRTFFGQVNFANFNRVAYESEPGKGNIKGIFRYLSNRTSSFWARCYPIKAKHIDQLAIINRPAVESLCKLALCNVDQGNRSVFVGNFVNLRELRLEFSVFRVDGELELQKLKSEFFASLVQLTSLETLELSNFQVVSSSFPSLHKLFNLTQLKMFRFYPITRLNEQIAPVEFCGHIASLFPNIEQLTMKTFDLELASYATTNIFAYFDSLKTQEIAHIDIAHTNTSINYFSCN